MSAKKLNQKEEIEKRLESIASKARQLDELMFQTDGHDSELEDLLDQEDELVNEKALLEERLKQFDN